MKKVTLFSDKQYKIKGFDHKETGLTFEYSTVGQVEETQDSHEKLFAFFGNIFSISIFEKRDECFKVAAHKSYYSRPYEAFCKENLSYMMKLLNSI